MLCYSSERLSLIGAPVTAGGKLCFVFPDQFDRLGFVLTLRQVYHLPLNAIRELDKHFPADCRHLVVERKLTIEELLDLAKMLPRGFAVKDLIMAKTWPWSPDSMAEMPGGKKGPRRDRISRRGFLRREMVPSDRRKLVDVRGIEPQGRRGPSALRQAPTHSKDRSGVRSRDWWT